MTNLIIGLDSRKNFKTLYIDDWKNVIVTDKDYFLEHLDEIIKWAREN